MPSDTIAVWSPFDDIFNLRGAAVEAEHLVPHIRPHSRIIDVGCGIGSITLDFARMAPDGYVLGVDFSADSIATATARAQAAGLTNVEFIQGDAMDLPSTIPSDSFDISHSHQLLLHLSDPVAALKSMRRLIKPGGLVATRDNYLVSVYPNTPAIQRNWDLYRTWSRENGAEPDAGLVNQIWMHDAGFAWDHITVGGGLRCYSGDRKRMFANTLKKSFAPVYGRTMDSEEDQRWLADFERDWSEWAEKPESKFFSSDGWVIAVK